jgi:hypothetical protein
MAPPSKKRKITVTAPEKIEFDPSAREEYLTGFHKRKVARQKFAQEEIVFARAAANSQRSSANSAKSISRSTSKK